jgi:hypothetical protein
MRVIRKEQLEAFRAAAEKAFKEEMLIHLREFSPALIRATGEEQMRRAIELGMQRAYGYGFRNRGPVRLYLEMILLFGTFFDTDPQYPWAGELLRDDSGGDQMLRAERLFQKTIEYRRSVAGKEDTYTLAALRDIAQMAEMELPPFNGDMIQVMQQCIERVYPAKAEFVGADGLEKLILEARDAAAQYDFSSERGQALMVVLMLAFGHGCAEDPLYPWIGRTLLDPNIIGPGARAKRLERKALAWLQHVLAHFEGTPQL